MKFNLIVRSLALAGLVISVSSAAAEAPKDATAATQQVNNALFNQLPFSDNTDFTNAHKGFIAPLPQDIIKGEQGNVIWNPQQYSFIKEGDKAPETVNPSLWRQSQLINISGLFEVTDGVYQIRNLDLSNMTIIEGKEGVTVVDPLVSAETAKVGMELYFKNRGKKPVVAIIYTHSHVDHYGGVRGVVEEADVKSGKVKIYAPAGFMEAAVAENIMAGNVMSRRASYMYGNLLKPDAKGQVGAGLGTTTSAGTVTLIAPTNIIEKDGQKEVIDGLTYDFMLAPGSEAPSEMLWYIEEKKLIESAEDVTHTLHNTYSLRGAKIREPLPWSKYINQAIVRWGDKAEIIMAHLLLPHVWPLCVILLLAGLTALYFYPVGLLAFVLPLWITLPIASWVLNDGLNLHFVIIWSVFSLILICGRFILLSWFDEAWRRNQQNQLLISRLDALAHQDPLTTTANRRKMEVVLENAVEQKKPFSLIMLDIDYFKRYNDTYGHQAGDDCLTRVARVLKQSVRTPDDVVSRYGGEEFVVILFNCPENIAEKVAVRIQDGLRAESIPHSASSVSDRVTVSMGIAGMVEGLAGTEIIARADAALYRAKEAGRDRWSL